MWLLLCVIQCIRIVITSSARHSIPDTYEEVGQWIPWFPTVSARLDRVLRFEFLADDAIRGPRLRCGVCRRATKHHHTGRKKNATARIA